MDIEQTTIDINTYVWKTPIGYRVGVIWKDKVLIYAMFDKLELAIAAILAELPQDVQGDRLNINVFGDIDDLDIDLFIKFKDDIIEEAIVLAYLIAKKVFINGIEINKPKQKLNIFKGGLRNG